MSLIGTFETWRPTLTMSDFQGKTGSSRPTTKMTRLTQAELVVGLPVLWDGSPVQHHDAVFAIAGRAN
jgi:hypothetical protein